MLLKMYMNIYVETHENLSICLLLKGQNLTNIVRFYQHDFQQNHFDELE